MARMPRLLPRTLAGQAVALLLLVVLAIVVGGSVLAIFDARIDGEQSARDKVTTVAVGLAASPSTSQAMVSDDPTERLQPLTERIRKATGVDFITVMKPDGTRVTHTNPAEIGQRYLGSRTEALAGQTYTQTFTGTLGPSIRTITPIRDDQGQIVGLVSAGITMNTLGASWRAQLPLILGVGALAFVVAGGGLLLIRRRIRRATGGLAPDELRLMYEHHDAVLHSVREGLIVVDDGKVVLANDEARRLMHDEEGKPDLPEFLLDSRTPLDDVQLAEGGRVLLVNRAPVADDRQSAVITIRDRTELSEAMGELDSMTVFAEALRSQAHEAANRMHTVVALIEMGRGDEAAQMGTTELALSQHLIDRMTRSVREPALAALLLGKSAQASERGIEFTVTEDSQLDDAATTVLSTREMITVVGNLIDNALDAADVTDPWVEVTVAGDAEGVRIVVADSGAGMDEGLFTRAQRRGYSTKAGGDATGRGLGLALVAQVVARHHGTLYAENTYGSVITVEIPGSTPGGEGTQS